MGLRFGGAYAKRLSVLRQNLQDGNFWVIPAGGSSWLGTMGFGLPAAMGAWAAAPDRKIVSVSGDGGLGQYLAEFMTAVKYGMNITHVLLNNSELGKISKEQRDGEWKVWQTDLHNLNFAEYAKLCGGMGIRVESGKDLRDAFDQALRRAELTLRPHRPQRVH